MSKYHCCATCVHFRVVKKAEGTEYVCSRLKFETKPRYQFDCWNPKENIRKLMDKE